MHAELPSHLAGGQATGIHPGQTVAQFELGSLKNFIYLIIDWSARRFFVVDPQSDLTPVLSAAKDHGLTLDAVLLTHSHHDHVAGIPGLQKSHPSVPVLCHELDFHRVAARFARGEAYRLIEDGEVLKLGALEIDVLHTPGHSAGECSYFIRGAEHPYILTGDTVFIRDCGRTDFADGDNTQMFQSIQRVAALPPETVLLPGHHYQSECASTVGREKAESPPFRCRSVQELAALP